MKTTDEMKRRKEEADRLYAQYGKALEAKHWGKYVAISSTGRTILGTRLLTVIQKATQTFGPGNYVFKVGGNAAKYGSVFDLSAPRPTRTRILKVATRPLAYYNRVIPGGKVKSRPLSYYNRLIPGGKITHRPLTYYDRFLKERG